MLYLDLFPHEFKKAITTFEFNTNIFFDPLEMFKLSFFYFHNKLKQYLVFNLPKTTLNSLSESNAGLPV